MKAIKSNKTDPITNFQTVFKGNSKKPKFKTNTQNIFQTFFFIIFWQQQSPPLQPETTELNRV